MNDQMTPAKLRAAADRTAGGYAWGDHQTEQADNELLESAARRLADVIEYAERIAGSNRAESPFAVERVRHHDALSILRIARGETNEGEGNEHSG